MEIEDCRSYRYKLEIAYKGSNYFGWQRQDDLSTVQGVLEKSLNKLYKQEVTIFGAGRTDKGVHATKQVAHYDVLKFYDPARIKLALNSFLRYEQIQICNVELVDDKFHARFSAKSRSYIYKIQVTNYRNVFEEELKWVIQKNLDYGLIKQACEIFVGTHDFAAFRAADCQAKNTIRTVNEMRLITYGQELNIFIRAPSFLHNQVRIMVGCIYNIARGNLKLDDIPLMFKSNNRTLTSFTAPAHGLYLVDVQY